MRTCRVCGQAISSGTTYCRKCLIDPTSLSQLRSGKRTILQKSLDKQERRKRRIVFITSTVICSCLAGCGAFVHWFIKLPKTNTAAELSTVKPPTATELSRSTFLGGGPSQTSLKGVHSDISQHMIESYGQVLTRQYQSTPWEVTVSGSDSMGTLTFDCSGDPHAADVCFMLYKQYPERSEALVLRGMGVRTLHFSSGFLAKHWTKVL